MQIYVQLVIAVGDWRSDWRWMSKKEKKREKKTRKKDGEKEPHRITFNMEQYIWCKHRQCKDQLG